MTTRELVSEDARLRLYRIRDDAGTIIGWDSELIPTPTEVNQSTLRQRALGALATNAAYIAQPNPTVAQNAAQLKSLSRHVNALIRLVLDATDTTDGT